MRRLPVMLAGLLLGFLAGGLVLVAGAVALLATVPPQTSRAMLEAAAWALTRPPSDGGDVVLRIGVALWRSLLAVCLGPVAAAAALGEVTGRRTLPVLGATAGLLAALGPLVWLAGGRAVALGGSGRLFALLFLSGVASGATYWLLAGAPSPPK